MKVNKLLKKILFINIDSFLIAFFTVILTKSFIYSLVGYDFIILSSRIVSICVILFVSFEGISKSAGRYLTLLVAVLWPIYGYVLLKISWLFAGFIPFEVNNAGNGILTIMSILMILILVPTLRLLRNMLLIK